MKVRSSAEIYAKAEAKGIDKVEIDNLISWQLKQGLIFELYDGWYVKYE